MPVAAASNAIVTLAEVRVFGASAVSDDKLQTVINAVSQAVENELNRVLKSVTYGEENRDIYQGSGSRTLMVRSRPVTSLDKVLIGGVEVDLAEVKIINANEGRLWRKSGWPRVCPGWGALVADPDTDEADYNIELEYVGGFTTIPDDLKMVVIDEILAALSPGSGIGGTGGRLKSETTPGGRSVTYEGNSGNTATFDRSWFSSRTLAVLSDYANKDIP